MASTTALSECHHTARSSAIRQILIIACPIYRSRIDELTSRTFWEVIGKKKPAVVLFHEYDDVDCQALPPVDPANSRSI